MSTPRELITRNCMSRTQFCPFWLQHGSWADMRISPRTKWSHAVEYSRNYRLEGLVVEQVREFICPRVVFTTVQLSTGFRLAVESLKRCSAQRAGDEMTNSCCFVYSLVEGFLTPSGSDRNISAALSVFARKSADLILGLETSRFKTTSESGFGSRSRKFAPLASIRKNRTGLFRNILAKRSLVLCA